LGISRKEKIVITNTTIGVTMFLHVVDAKYENEYKIWVKFNNDEEGIINLQNELDGEMFEPLQNLDSFKKFHVDSEIETIVWENGADMSPEFLYENMIKMRRSESQGSRDCRSDTVSKTQ
jgi:hypothetical protein